MFEKEKQLIFIGSDHAGFSTKSELKAYLEGEGFDLTDLGCFSEDPCDYPDVAREVAEKVLEHKDSFGILICGSGAGMAIAANKLHGIRAIVAVNEQMAEMARLHNNANILSLGSRLNDAKELEKIAIKFLHTAFEANAERHVRRVQKLNEM